MDAMSPVSKLIYRHLCDASRGDDTAEGQTSTGASQDYQNARGA